MSTLISSPHIHGGDTIRANMVAVILALVPSSLVAIYMFGWLAVFLFVICIGGCMLTEMVCLRMMGRSTAPVGDGSAALTGLFLALVLPASVPWWMPLIGCVVAILLSKQVYGGIGYNPFNPALTARVVLLISFPLNMTTWIMPMHAGGVPQVDLYDFAQCWALFWHGPAALGQGLDAITMASPLGHVKTEWSQGIGVAEALQNYHYSYLHAFLGGEAGSLGETSALALLLGGGYLLARHIISWHIPTAYIATVALLALIFHQVNGEHFAPPMFHVLAGGLILCAFFMATDPVTSPVTPRGQLVFGVGCGVLTWSIRTFGGYPEGAMFSVLLMNSAVPLIDHYFRPRVYGKGLR
ncbi:MAG TPA: RnfABCDGE type electron transport complex subunit D [Mariprofundaceae bacterium]|nr:RnfABCDGE type electron transport complex subunit D [Mariprofundaceae bacterium]